VRPQAVAQGLTPGAPFPSPAEVLPSGSGPQFWRFETGHWVKSSPAVVDGVVYIGSSDTDGNVYAITEG